jgi:hypothetical protein
MEVLWIDFLHVNAAKIALELMLQITLLIIMPGSPPEGSGIITGTIEITYSRECSYQPLVTIDLLGYIPHVQYS